MKTIALKNLFAVTMAMALVAGTSTVSTALAQSNYEPYSFATLAGMTPDSGGFGGDGTGSDARFYYPEGVAVDSAGNVYVADTNNSTIRKITPAGVVSTLAGTAGVTGSTDATGAAARFNSPRGIATDSAGNVYVGDTLNFTIRKITPKGEVTTLAGTAGIFGSTDGTGAAASFNFPNGVATDGDGNVYVADTNSPAIRKITPAGVVTTLAGTPNVWGSTDGTGPAASFEIPIGVATDSAGNVYVGDFAAMTIRKITPAGVVTTLAGKAGAAGGTDGTGPAARFYDPAGVATDSAGNVYVADDFNNTIRKVTPAGAVSTLVGVAEPGGSFGALTPGPLPGVLNSPVALAVSGTSLYITASTGVAVVQNLP